MRETVLLWTLSWKGFQMTHIVLRTVAIAGTLAALTACNSAPEPGPAAPVGNPVLSLLPTALCAPGAPLAVTVVNTGSVDYGGGAAVTLTVGDSTNFTTIEPIPAGGTWQGQIPYPSIPGGDWTVSLRLSNQQPITQGCIG